MTPNRRILIVDDNASIHEDFGKVLGKKAGPSMSLRDLGQQLFDDAPAEKAARPAPQYELDSAFQGEEALAKVEKAAAEGRPYSLIFMDIRMPPGWDGIETTRRIWDKFPNTEIVVCTAYSDYSSDEIIDRLGSTDRLLLLKKPYDPIVVEQFALALTTKWNLACAVRSKMQSLEEAVSRRTIQLDKLVDTLTEKNVELEASMKRQKETHELLVQSSRLAALGEMAGGVAHEVNNPVAIIYGKASQLRRMAQTGTIDSNAVAGFAEIVEHTSLRIAKIVKGLRAFARDGKHDPFVEVSAEVLIDDILGLCRERFRSNGVDLGVSIKNKDLRIQCRPTQVSQVLLNLLNNAFDAVSGLEDKWVNLEVTEVGDSLRLSVIDSGKGVALEARGKIMQPFFTTKDIGKGTGLGLSISKGIVESHKGTLELDSASPNTRFNVDLPKVQEKMGMAA